MSEAGARPLLRLPAFGRDARVNALIGSGHFLSHYYQLCLPPMFIAWRPAFGVSFAELGLAMALMSGTTAPGPPPWCPTSAPSRGPARHRTPRTPAATR